MIVSFKDQATEDIFNGIDSKAARKACPQTRWRITSRKLDQLDSAQLLEELKVPPGNRLERRSGDRKVEYTRQMKLKRACKKLSDLARFYDFLAPVNKPATARAVQSLTAAPGSPLDHPRIGERLDEFEQRDVRRILFGRYEIRYETQESSIYVLRLWHTREDR